MSLESLLNQLQINQFQFVQAHTWLQKVATLTTQDESTDEILVDSDFQSALDTLTCDPSVRAAAKPVYKILADYLGSCTPEDIDGLDSLIYLLLQYLSRNIDQISAEIDQTWPILDPSGTFNQFIEALCFSVQVINTVRGNVARSHAPDVFFIWLSILVRRQQSQARNQEGLALLLSPGTLQLFLSATQRTLTQINNYIFDVPECIVGLLKDEMGRELIKKFIELSTEFTDIVIIESIFADIFTKSCQLRTVEDNMMVFAPTARISCTSVFALIQLTLKQLVGPCALQSRHLLTGNTQVKELQSKQKVAGTIVNCMIENLLAKLDPETDLTIRIKDCEFGDPSSSQQPVSDEDNPPSPKDDDEVEEDDEDDELPKDKKPTKKTKKKKSKAEVSLKDLDDLKEAMSDPLPCFWAQLLFLSPDRKDQREKVIGLIESNVAAIMKTMPCPQLLESFVAILTRMTFHERSTIRTIALETLSCLPKFIDSRGSDLPQKVLGSILARCSDSQPYVRCRAIDLFSGIVLKHMDWAIPVVDWGFVLTIFHLRVHDEKSTVRKSAIGFIEVFLAYAKQSNKRLSDFVQDEYLVILSEDASLTVRQKALSLLIILFGEDRDQSAQALAARCILQAALDNEDSIYTKAREAFRNEILGSLLRSLNTSQFHPLLVVIDSSAEASETLYRVVLIICRESFAEVTPIVRYLSSQTCSDNNYPFSWTTFKLLRTFLQVGVALGHTWRGLSSQLADSLFEILGRTIQTSEDVSQTRSALEVLAYLLPVAMTPNNVGMIRHHLRKVINALSIQPGLVRECIQLYILAFRENQSEIAEELMQLITSVRKYLLDLPKNPKGDPAEISVALQIAGIVYSTSSGSLAASHKLNIHLGEIALPLATVMVLIAKSALIRRPRVSITSETNPGQTSWLANVPANVRAIAAASLGQILTAHEAVAKKLINQYVQVAVMAYLSSPELGGLIVNTTVAVFDCSLRMTSLVDPYFCVLSSFLAHAKPAGCVNGFQRGQILSLLALLAAQDYLKPKGLVLYHVLSSLGDPEVRSLAEKAVSCIISPRARELVTGYFLEIVCFVCGYLGHPVIRLALDIHPMARNLGMMDELCIQNFCLRGLDIRREWIYSYLLSLASEHTRVEITNQILNDFLPCFLGGRDGGDMVDIPLSRETPDGLALSDILRIICSSDLRVTFSLPNTASTDDNGSGEAGEEEAVRERTAKFNRALLKEYMTKNVLPPLIGLRGALQEKNSALQRDIFECLCRILFEWREELDEMVHDAHLVSLIKRSEFMMVEGKCDLDDLFGRESGKRVALGSHNLASAIPSVSCGISMRRGSVTGSVILIPGRQSL